MCGGDLMWGLVRSLQVWVGVTVRIMIGYQLFQLIDKFLEVILLGRGGG